MSEETKIRSLSQANDISLELEDKAIAQEHEDNNHQAPKIDQEVKSMVRNIFDKISDKDSTEKKSNNDENSVKEFQKNLDEIVNSRLPESEMLTKLVGLFYLREQIKGKASESEYESLTKTLKDAMQNLVTPALYQKSGELTKLITEEDHFEDLNTLKSTYDFTKFVTKELNNGVENDQIKELNKKIANYANKSISSMEKEIDGLAEKTKDVPVYKKLEYYLEYQMVINDLKDNLPKDIENTIKNIEDKNRGYIGKLMPNLLSDFDTQYKAKTDVYEKLGLLSDLSTAISALSQIEKTPDNHTKEITEKMPVYANLIAKELAEKLESIILKRDDTPRNITFEEIVNCYGANRFLTSNFKGITFDTDSIKNKSTKIINEIKPEAIKDLEKLGKDFESDKFIKEFRENLEKGVTLEKIIPEPFILRSYTPELLNEDEEKKIRETLGKISGLYSKYMEKQSKEKNPDKDNGATDKTEDDRRVVTVEDEEKQLNPDKDTDKENKTTPNPDGQADPDDEKKKKNKGNTPIDFVKTDPTYANTKGPQLEEECLAIIANKATLSYTLYENGKEMGNGKLSLATPAADIRSGDIILKGEAGRVYKQLLSQGKSSKEALAFIRTQEFGKMNMHIVNDPKEASLSSFLAVAETEKLQKLVSQKARWETEKLKELSNTPGDKAIADYKKEKIEKFKELYKNLNEVTNFGDLQKQAYTYILSRKNLRIKTNENWQKSEDLSKADELKGKMELWQKETRKYKDLETLDK